MGQSSPEDDPGLLEYARLLRGRWLYIVAAAIAGGAIAALLAWLTPRTYEASVTMKVKSIMGAQLPPTAVATARTLLENRSTAARVVADLGLEREPRRLSAERLLSDHMRTEQVRNSELLQVYVRLDDPELAARAANRVAEEAVALSRRLIEQDVASAQRFLEEQVRQARARTQQLEQDVLSSRRSRRIDSSRKAEPGLSIVETDLEVARAVYRDLARRYERARAEVAGRSVGLEVQDPALPPGRVTGPSITSRAALGAALGLVASTLLLLAIAIVSRAA